MGRFISGGGGGTGTTTPPLSFGIGLTQSGLIVDLDPAEQIEIGGIYEIPNDGLQYARQYISGIPEWVPVTGGGLPFMGANPPPPIPPATAVVPGTLWWRVTDGQLFVYYTDAAARSQWVTASPTGEIVGAALVFPAPPAVGTIHPATNGVSYLWDGVAWIAQDETGGPVHIGPLPPLLVPPALVYEPGTLWWRNDPDGVLYIWYVDPTGPGQWVPATPASTQNINPAGNDPSQIGIVWVPDRGPTQGLELLDGYLTAPLASEFTPGVITEPELGDVEHVRVRDIATGAGKWVAATTGGGIGDVPPDPPIVWGRATGRWMELPDQSAKPAGNEPSLIGIVWVPQRSATQGLELLDGFLTAPLASPDMPGVINEPALGDVEHVRVRDIATGEGRWVVATTGGGIGDVPPDPVQAWARASGRWVDIPFPEAFRGLTYTRTAENHYYSLDVATGIDLGGVFVPAGQGLNLSLSGGLELAPATQSVIGGITEAPFDSKTYARQDAHWVEVVGGGGIGDVPVTPVQAWARANGRWVDVPVPDAGRGLTLTTNDSGINSYSLDVATGIDLGGVFVPFNVGLELTQVGGLSLAPATPDVIGGLLDAPRDDTGLKAWARRWGEWVPTLADAPDDEKLYGRQYSGLGTPADPKSMRWMEAVAPIDLELISNNKVDRSGDTMQGGLYLPRSEIDPNDPGGPTLEYPNDVYHAVPKWYCDANAGGFVHTDISPPTTPKDGQMWWRSDSAGLYIWYEDINSAAWVQVNGMAGLTDADVIHDAPVDDTVYGRLNKDWHPVNVVGDFKWGFQAADHEGWIKLDGRPLAQLNARQSANASALGFATAIPDATGKVPMQNGLPLGDSSGTMSRTLSQANLPDISLTAGSAGAHAHTAGSAGSHQHRSRGGVAGSAIQFEDMGGTGAWENWGGYTVIGDTGDLYKTDQYLSETGGAHTHATDSQGAHTHVVPLGGTALPLDITPASLAVTAFIFLGR